jgi:hypothetical protein
MPRDSKNVEREAPSKAEKVVLSLKTRILSTRKGQTNFFGNNALNNTENISDPKLKRTDAKTENSILSHILSLI